MFNVLLMVYAGLVVVVFGLDIALTIRDHHYSICGMKIRRPSAKERARWAAEEEAQEWSGWREWADAP